ncbi:MAG: hypothetical protein ACTSO9_19360 [Candidatus Helarchaeota archaeon]
MNLIIFTEQIKILKTGFIPLIIIKQVDLHAKNNKERDMTFIDLAFMNVEERGYLLTEYEEDLK